MRLFLSGLGGFLAALLSLTLFGSLGFTATAFTYSIALHLLFINHHVRRPAYFLAGSVIGFELLSSSRFGLHSLYAFILVILYVVFKERLRFTSLSVRFTIALSLSLLAYGIMIPSSFLVFSQWLSLLLVFAITVSISLIRLQAADKPTYEFS